MTNDLQSLNNIPLFFKFSIRFNTGPSVARWFNSSLGIGNGQVPKLMPDSVNLVSKELRVGLTTFLSKGAITPTLDTLKPGMEVYQTGSSNKDAYRIATGKLTAFAGKRLQSYKSLTNNHFIF